MNSSHRSAIGQSVIWLAGMAFSVGVGESAIAQVPDSSTAQQVPEPIASAPSGTENAVHAASNVTVLHVNSVAGQDQSGSGESNAPFRSLTHALQVAQPNTVIVLAPGTYSASNGESFPIQLKSGVTIQGNPENSGQDVIIKGGGMHNSPAFGEQNVTLVGADQAGLTGVTVTNTDPKGYGLWIESTSPIVVNNTFHANGYDGVAVAGRANPMLRSNLFAGNGASGVSLFGQAGGTLRNNTFDSNSFGVNIAHQARPILVGNRILRNRDGIVVQDEARPALQVNIIEGQERDGLVARANAQPNLGTPDQAGGNIFRSNGRLDINAEAVQTPIPVYGSQFEASAARGKIDVTGAIALNANASTTVATAPVTPTSNPFSTTLSEMSRTNQVSVTPINPVTSGTTLPNSAASNAVTPSPTVPSTTASTSTTQAAPASQAGTNGGAAPPTSSTQVSRAQSVPPISAMDAWIQNPSAERPAAVNATLETTANASESTAAAANTVTAESTVESNDEVVEVAIATPPPPATPTTEISNPEPSAEDAEEPATEIAEELTAASPSEAASESASDSDSNQIAIRIPTPTLPTVNSSPTVEPAAPDATELPVEPESANDDQQITSEPAASETTSEESSPAAATVTEAPRGGAASRPLVTEITIEPILEPAAAQAAAANLEETTDEPVAVSPTSEESAAAAVTAEAEAEAEAEQEDIQIAVRPAAESASDSLVTEVEFTAPSSSSTSDSASASESSEPSPTLSAAPASTPPATAADLQLPAQPIPEVSAARISVDTATASSEAPADEAALTEAEPEATPLPTITSQVTVTDSTSVPAMQDAPAETSTTTARSHSQLPAAPANASVVNNDLDNDTLALATPPQNLTNDQAISIPVPTPATSSSGDNSSSAATPEGWPSLLHARPAQESISSDSSDIAAAASSETSETTVEAPAAISAEATAETAVEPAAEPETIAAAPAETVRSLEFGINSARDVAPEDSQQAMPEATEAVDEDSSSVETTEAETTEAASRTSTSRDHSDLATAIADRPFALRSRSDDQRSTNQTNASQETERRDTEREFTIAARTDLEAAVRDVTDTDVAATDDADDADAVREFEFTAPTASPEASSTPAASVATPSTATRREPTLPRLPARATREQVLAMTSNTRATGSLVSALATRSTTGTETSAISIPVSPAGGATPGTTSTVTNGEAEQVARAIAEAEENALPVPSINIPLARSSVPAVNVSPNATRSPIDPPPPPTRASSLGLGYRLIVDAPSTAEQERLKQHVRDAFRIQYDGRSMMQAGAFRDRTEAAAVMQMLQESGFNVILAE